MPFINPTTKPKQGFELTCTGEPLQALQQGSYYDDEGLPFVVKGPVDGKGQEELTKEDLKILNKQNGRFGRRRNCKDSPAVAAGVKEGSYQAELLNTKRICKVHRS